MPIVTTRAVILQTYPYSDTSKILRLMTLDHGPRSAIAKGARRPKSRFGGVIEPFAEGEATIYMKENRDLHTLSEFDLVKERQALGLNLHRFAAASVLCELVMRLAPEHRDDRLFRLLTAGLDALLEAEEGEVRALSLRAIWSLVGALGFAPELRACVDCGRRIEPDESVRFDFRAGGLRCRSCGREGHPLPSAELRVLRRLAAGEAPEREVRDGQLQLVRDFIRYHLAEGARLRSLDFLTRGDGR